MTARDRSVTDFSIGRFTRLFPALFVFATAAYLVILATSDLPVAQATERYLRALSLFPKGPWIDGAIWTLTVEALFYAVVALIIALGQERWMPRVARTLVYIPFATILVALLQIGLGASPEAAPAVKLFESYPAKFFLLSTGSFFAVGMLAFEIRERGVTTERRLTLATACLTSAAALYLFAIRTPGVTKFEMSPFVPAAVWCLITGLSLTAIHIEARITAPAIYRRLARSVGLMTYPLYLVNQIVGAFLISCLITAGANVPQATLIDVVAILVISFLFARWAEPPMRRGLTRWLERRRAELPSGRGRGPA